MDKTLNNQLYLIRLTYGRQKTLKNALFGLQPKTLFGCPKRPSFPEAFIVAKADELDALTIQMINYNENAKTEDSFIYSKDFKTNIYLK